jgi:hypothetical protein
MLKLTAEKHDMPTTEALTASQRPVTHKNTLVSVRLVGMDLCHHGPSDGARTPFNLAK